MPGAGAARHRVTVQQATQGVDSRGGLVDGASWSTYCTRQMTMRPAQSDERFTDNREHASQQWVFTCRRDSVTKAITPKMRLSFESRFFDIRGVPPTDGRMRMWLKIVAEELV